MRLEVQTSRPTGLPKGVWVLLEHREGDLANGSLELVCQARAIAHSMNEALTAVILGALPEDLSVTAGHRVSVNNDVGIAATDDHLILVEFDAPADVGIRRVYPDQTGLSPSRHRRYRSRHMAVVSVLPVAVPAYRSRS